MSWFSDVMTRKAPEAEKDNILEIRLLSNMNWTATLTKSRFLLWRRSIKDPWYFNSEVKRVNHWVNMTKGGTEPEII